MSATTTVSPPATNRAAGHSPDILEEIASGVGANGEALSITMDLLKRIIELLLPKAAGDGPTLAELMAAVLAALRELLLVEKSNARGIDEILQRLDGAGISVSDHPHPNGARHP